MSGVPCVKLDWETFMVRIRPKTTFVYENKECVWTICDGFLILADKPDNKCGSKTLIENSIPALGFGDYNLKR